jgi:hypothetical protein
MDIPFIPSYGTEEEISEAAKRPGYFFVATDSGKIYFDTEEGARIGLGGGGV